MANNPEHVAEAYLKVARVNHYLVMVDPTVSSADLEAAEQILITWDNAKGNKNRALNLALDLIETAIKSARAWEV